MLNNTIDPVAGTGGLVPPPIKGKRARKKRIAPTSGARALDQEKAAVSVGAPVIIGPTKDEWETLSALSGDLADLADTTVLRVLLDEAAYELEENSNISFAVDRIGAVRNILRNYGVLASYLYRRAEDIFSRHWSAIVEPDADPVVEFWPDLLAAEAAFNTVDDGVDKARYDAVADQHDETAERLVALQPTTPAGWALKLKYIARMNCHHKEVDGNGGTHETRIIRDLVRTLSGDPTWTAASEEK